MKGVKFEDFTPVQPISQHRIWKAFEKTGKGAADKAIAKVHEQDRGFNLDKGSWTSDRNWVKGYEDVLDPMNKLSASFHNKIDEKNIDTNSNEYRTALVYLLLSQTSCFRYWGEGAWTNYAKELCRRGFAALEKL
jgi:hypothetical protein